MALTIVLIDDLTKTKGYVDFEKVGRAVRYLNTYLESSGKMTLKEYKSIVNRITGLGIPINTDIDDSFGFIPSKDHETFYSEIMTLDSDTDCHVGRLAYRNLGYQMEDL